MLRRKLPAWLGVLCMLVAAQAMASISLSSTRVVFDGAHKEANVTVRNGNQDVLIQSWIDRDDGSTQNIPFAVAPPLARVQAKDQQQLRILYEGVGMPTDKESMVWLNVQEIPQKSGAENTLQLAVRQRIKIFFRPANLPGDALQAPSQLDWTLSRRASKTELTVKNPSLYHVSMADVTLVDGSRKELVADSTMIAPGGSLAFTIKPLSSGNSVQLKFRSVNDYGAQIEYAASLPIAGSSVVKAVQRNTAP